MKLKPLLLLMLIISLNTISLHAQEEATLTISFPGDLRSEVVNDLIAQFVSAQSEEGREVTVIVNEPTDGYEDQLLLDFAAGASPDVFAVSPNSIAEFADAGLILPLDPYTSEWDEWQNFPEGIRGMTTINDVNYAILHTTDTRVLWYRLDVFEAAGIDTPWQPTSWEDIFEAANAIQLATPDVIPLEVQAGTLWGEGTTIDGFFMLLRGAGGIIYDPLDQKWVVESDAILQTFQFYIDMFENNYSPEEPYLEPEPWVPFLQEALPDGELGIALGISALHQLYAPDSDWAAIENRDDVLAWTPMPAREPGAGINGWDYVGMGGGWSWAIASDTSDVDLAWEFVEFMSSADSITAYTDVVGGIPTRTDVTTTDFNGALIEQVLPYQSFRPGNADYPRISEEIQIATERILLGETDAQVVMDTFASAVIDIVGEENTKAMP
ncbi:MAG: extracellular solute-binding protein [Chloroflexota bacterium]